MNLNRNILQLSLLSKVPMRSPSCTSQYSLTKELQSGHFFIYKSYIIKEYGGEKAQEKSELLRLFLLMRTQLLLERIALFSVCIFHN